jgi:hypothetical protein
VSFLLLVSWVKDKMKIHEVKLLPCSCMLPIILGSKWHKIVMTYSLWPSFGNNPSSLLNFHFTYRSSTLNLKIRNLKCSRIQTFWTSCQHSKVYKFQSALDFRFLK